jgi:hypothetical protein
MTFGAAIVFLGLSAADFFLTWRLVDVNCLSASESNPLAAAILDSQGWLGLAVFKLAMMAFITALGLFVYSRRPRLANFVMVFGCGAQAAVVMTSLFHLRAASQGVLEGEPELQVLSNAIETKEILPPGAIAALTRPGIQAELRLSEEQIADVREADRLRRLLNERMQHGHLETCKTILERLTSMEERLAADLSKEQVQRIRQLAWQHRGLRALADRDVSKALSLTTEQSEDIAAILDAWDESEPTSEACCAEQPDLNRQLASVLDATQLTRWRDLLGEPRSSTLRTSFISNADD